MEDKFALNIGCVIYTETDYGIKAEWLYHRNNELEHGLGTGKRLTKYNPENVFEGEYEITYLDIKGNILALLHLIIKPESEYYKLTWKNKEKVTDMGVGMQRYGNLIVSYTEVD